MSANELPMRPPDDTPPPSDAILTVPNLLTFLRLALIPVVLWLALGLENIGAAFVIALVGFATDLIDGKVARRYGQVTRLGILLDPLSDRLALASGAVIFIVHELMPLWAVLVVLARDVALVAVGGPIMRARRIPIPPVTALGKKASFGVSLCFALFFGSAVGGPADPSEPVRAVAWVLYVISVPLYYWTAIDYARAGLRGLREGGSRSAG